MKTYLFTVIILSFNESDQSSRNYQYQVKELSTNQIITYNSEQELKLNDTILISTSNYILCK